MNFGCSSNLVTSLVKNSSEYQKEICKKASASLGGGMSGFGGAFKASSEYKKKEEIMKDGEKGIAEASA